MFVRKLVDTELMLSVQVKIFAAANRICTACTSLWTFIVTRTSSSTTGSLAKAFVLARTVRAVGITLGEVCVAKVFAAAL